MPEILGRSEQKRAGCEMFKRRFEETQCLYFQELKGQFLRELRPTKHREPLIKRHSVVSQNTQILKPTTDKLKLFPGS